tara:strand:- start:326 stop:613 length:288 start_codon:yes stop_codon:yes gene_type:complete
MEIHYIIEGVLAAGGFMVAIIIKRAYQSIDDLWRKQDEMTRRLTEMAIELPKNYVTKSDLSQAMDIVHNRFDKIDTKLEKISISMPRTRKMSDTQ